MNQQEALAEVSAADEAVLAPIRGFIAAMDRREFLVPDYFTDSPSIIDPFAPFHWSGPDALQRWAGEVEESIARSPITDYRAEILGVKKLVADGDHAYANIDLCYRISMRDLPEPILDRGTFTFALHRTDKGWRIAGATWAGQVNT